MTPTKPIGYVPKIETCTCISPTCELSHPDRVDLSKMPNRQQRRAKKKVKP